MTEIYYGPLDSVTGDRRKEKVQDPYHPKYPDVGVYKKMEGLVEKPTTNADQLSKS